MYGLKSPNVLLYILLPIFLICFGMIFVFQFFSGVPLSNLSLEKGTILNDSSSPMALVNNVIISSESSCNGSLCAKKGDSIWIIFNGEQPSESKFLSDFFLVSSFSTIGLVLLIGCMISFFRRKKYIKIIQGYIQMQSYITMYIVDIKTIRSRSRKTQNRILGYKYVCKATLDGKEYISDLVRTIDFHIGSSVSVYINETQKSGIYWIDLNTIVYNEDTLRISKKMYEEVLMTNEKSAYEFFAPREDTNSIWSFIRGYVFLFLFGLVWSGFAYLCFYSGAIFGGILMLIIPIFILWVVISAVWNFLIEYKERIFMKKSLCIEGAIHKIEKVGKYRNVGYGYIPEDESHSVDTMLRNNITQSDAMLQKGIGYKYKFLVSVKDKILESRVFYSPFPKKAQIGARVNIYINPSDEYCIDLASIDVLN